MTVLTVVLGAALVVLVAWDIMLTLLHPSARGPLSYAANRATWSAARAVSVRLLRGRGLSFAGPFAVVMNVWVWVFGLWIAFALIYLPFVASFSYDPPGSFVGPGFPEALYLSGAALTTVGFGDVAATNDLLRLVTALEAASGFAVLSAATAFILSIYPLISHLRSTGIQLADSGALELRGAARAVRQGGPTQLAATLRGLTESHEHLRRFPVLYYFESGNHEESLTTVLRGSALLLAALHCDPRAQVGEGSMYADALGHVISRLLDDLDRDFVGGRQKGSTRPGPQGEDADARVTALLATLDPGCGPATAPHPGRAEVTAVLCRADALLAAVAHEHGQPTRPLLPEPARAGPP